MQVPPEQPIGPGGYPRPTGYGQPEKFGGDLAVGIILIVLNAFGACFGGMAIAGGGILAGAGKNMDIKDAAGNQMSSQTAQTLGGVAMIVGIVLLIGSVLSIIGAVGVIKGLKWGFTLTFVMGVLMVLGSIVPTNIIGIILGLFGAIYCGLRLFGNVGPKPTA
jgi:hypothetical protein